MGVASKGRGPKNHCAGGECPAGRKRAPWLFRQRLHTASAPKASPLVMRILTLRAVRHLQQPVQPIGGLGVRKPVPKQVDPTSRTSRPLREREDDDSKKHRTAYPRYPRID